MRAKTLQISLIFFLIVLLLPVTALCDDVRNDSDNNGDGEEKKDYVYISINMKGDAYITITNEGSSIEIVYNGKDILNEFATEEQFRSLSKHLYELRNDFRDLINSLDLTFEDLYGKTYYLANLIGFLEDNSTVAIQLKSGNITLADFIEQLFSLAEKQKIMIEDLSLRIEAVKEENYKEINDLWNHIVENLSVLFNGLNETQYEVQLLRSEINVTNQILHSEINATNQRIDNLVDALDSVFNDLYNKIHFLAYITGIYEDSNSTVTLLLKSGNVTLTWFIEKLADLTENQEIKISEANMKIDSLEDRINATDRHVYELFVTLIAACLLNFIISITASMLMARRKPKQP